MSKNVRLTEDQMHEVKKAIQQRLTYLRSIDLANAPSKAARAIRDAEADLEAVYADLAE